MRTYAAGVLGQIGNGGLWFSSKANGNLTFNYANLCLDLRAIYIGWSVTRAYGFSVRCLRE